MKLRDYQLTDALTLAKRPTMACFNEQRTGKTPTALATIQIKNLTDQKILIVTTASTVYQWVREYEAWLEQPCVACTGILPKKMKAIENWTHGLVISIDSFKSTTTSPGLVKPILEKHPAMLILDEAHRIKNPKSANAHALFKAAERIPHRLALTGTPAPNKPQDIFCILKFLEPNKWGSFWDFQNEYFQREIQQVRRIQNGFPSIQQYNVFEKFLPGMEKKLQDKVKEISIQRKRKEVMPWLPDKFYERVYLQPTTDQKRYLKELKRDYKTAHINTSNALSRIVRYRQICLDPAILELNGGSPKTEFVTQYIVDHPEEQIIIFSKFTSYLTILYKTLATVTRCGIIIGDTPLKTRSKIVKDFQDGLCRVILINIDAGKEGLTLDAADTTIFTDKYPPIGDIQQAEDRFIASTEARAHKAHKIIELALKNTFDEQLYALLEQRKNETDVLNDYNNYILERSKI